MISISILFFFFNDTATTEIYTLSLHDALPILRWEDYTQTAIDPSDDCTIWYVGDYLKKGALTYSTRIGAFRSEEHTSELQSRPHLVCRLLLEKKNINHYPVWTTA